MLYPSINKIRKKADSRYTLVILAAKRARDIIDGKPALTEDSVARPVSIAAHEIAEDLITYEREGAARRDPDLAEDEGIIGVTEYAADVNDAEYEDSAADESAEEPSGDEASEGEEESEEKESEEELEEAN